MNRTDKTRKAKAGLLLIASPRFKNLSGPVKELFEQVLKVGTTQHFAVVDGDYRAELKDFAELMGFEFFDIR